MKGDLATWNLIRLVRHLPDLTPDEVEKMKA
jgi:hypothetical protein